METAKTLLQEQQNRTDEDNYGMDTDVRQINSYLQEVNLERELVLSYGVESTSALLVDFTPYITTLELEQSKSVSTKYSTKN